MPRKVMRKSLIGTELLQILLLIELSQLSRSETESLEFAQKAAVLARSIRGVG